MGHRTFPLASDDVFTKTVKRIIPIPFFGDEEMPILFRKESVESD